MYTCQTTPRALAQAISLALGIAALPASALEYTWADWHGDWETAANWDPAGLPQDGDSVAIHGGSLVTYNTTSLLYLTSVIVDGSAELHMIGSSLHAETLVAGATAPSVESDIHLSGGYLIGTTLQIGRNAGSDGRFLWDGGDLGFDQISVGTGGSGAFVYDVDAAWNLAEHQSVVIGEQAGSTGVFEQRQGTIDSWMSQIVVGDAGNGTYRQLGGNHYAAETVIGRQPGSEGTYEQSAWPARHYSERTIVGDAGIGHYIQNHGEHYTGELIIGRSAGGVGDYQLDSSADLRANLLVLGQEAGGQGTFTWTYGNLEVGQITIGQGGAGTFVMDGWSSLHLDEYGGLVIGELAGSEGLFEQRTGNVTNTQTLFIGQAGLGLYRHIEGQHQTGSTVLGRDAGSEGVYELLGEGAVHSSNHTVVGLQGTGRFLHAAGVHMAHQVDVGGYEGTGYYQLSGGWLDTQNLNINNGEFTWTGGDLYARDMRIGSGNPYGSSAAFIQDIGSGNTLTLDYGKTLLIGHDGGDGVYEQRSGDVDVRDAQVVIGGSGQGTYYHLDGVHHATETVIGRHQAGSWWGTSEGIYVLSGDSAVHAAQRTVVGDTGHGRFLQSAGSNDTPELIVGQTGSGEYVLGGGVLNAQSIVLGDQATQTGAFYRRSGGSFVWSGGELYFDSLLVGRMGSGEFVQDIGAGNVLSLAPHQTIVLAEAAHSQGAFVQRSGDVDSRSSPIIVGQAGTGSYDQMSGLHQATETLIGHLSGSEGYYYLNGTGAHITDRTVVGDAGYGAYFQLTGTMHDTQELVIAQSTGSYGYYDLIGGELNTATTRIAATQGATGAVRIHGPDAHWHNGGAIHVGAESSPMAPPGAGWVELRDGALISATAVIVADTGALRGAGTIVADVFNNGDLSPGRSSVHFGHLDIFGDYVQQDAGTLSIQIGAGLNQDMVNIFGDATLGGTLSVTLSNAFDIGLGDSFDILYANMVYGGFDDLLFPIFDGLTFDIFYDLNTVRLTVVSAVPVPAAAWLFGSGVVALMGMARRRKAA